MRHGAAVGARYQLGTECLGSQGCTICWKAVDYEVTDPQLVGTNVALHAAGRLERVVIRRFGFPAFLQLENRPCCRRMSSPRRCRGLAEEDPAW
jgi:hypothetical protein